MNRTRFVAGLALLAFPLAVQIPFSLLAARYSYPDILERNAGEVLARFAEGGPGLIWTWYAYALCTVGLGFVAVMLPGALGSREGGVTRLSVVTGVLASVVQLFGLLRWTMVVPFLATRWGAQPDQRATIELVYEVQHRLFGVMLGEHGGQLFMGAWTALISIQVLRVAAPRWIAIVGFVATAAFWLGLGAQLARVVPMVSLVPALPLIAFVVWSAWAVSLGGLVVWRSRRAA